MALVKFNQKYRDLELGRIVEADEEIEMTLKRADELVETINKQVEGFSYERLDEPETRETKDKEETKTKEK